MTEIWRPIVGFEDSFSISNEGRIRSDAREVPWNGTIRRVKTRILATHKDPQGYPRVTLGVDGKLYSKLIHIMLLEAFVSPRPEGMYGLHRDDSRTNFDLNNLYWGTQSQNGQDAVRNKRNRWANRTHCSNGHEFTPENTYRYPNKGKRLCRICHRATGQARRKAI